eukprot:871913-Pyramimonas_sp.AAC.1
MAMEERSAREGEASQPPQQANLSEVTEGILPEILETSHASAIAFASGYHPVVDSADGFQPNGGRWYHYYTNGQRYHWYQSADYYWLPAHAAPGYNALVVPPHA